MPDDNFSNLPFAQDLSKAAGDVIHGRFAELIVRLASANVVFAEHRLFQDGHIRGSLSHRSFRHDGTGVLQIDKVVAYLRKCINTTLSRHRIIAPKRIDHKIDNSRERPKIIPAFDVERKMLPEMVRGCVTKVSHRRRRSKKWGRAYFIRRERAIHRRPECSRSSLV